MTLRITKDTYPTLIEELGKRVTGSLNLENSYPAVWCEVEIRARAKAAKDLAWEIKINRVVYALAFENHLLTGYSK